MRSDAVMFASHDYPAVLPISRTAIAGTFEQANDVFMNCPGLQLVLCVAVPDCLWVTCAREAWDFFSDKIAAGAPEAEIEITPEMMETGLIWLHSYNREADIPEKIITSIFREMSSLALKKGRRSL
jgi:hypothetical protein